MKRLPKVIAPHALLLDFGGVIAEAPPRKGIPDRLVNAVHAAVQGTVSRDRITTGLVSATAAYATWRDSMSTEVPRAHLWEELVAGDWPDPARRAVGRHAEELSRIWVHRPGWQVRPGIRRCLATAAAAGLPVAVVSNTMSAAAHRGFLDEVGLSRLLEVQIYSDELRIRKPDPEPIRQAAARLGVPPELCWFVGDSLHRDILCARRAAGAAILMRSHRTAAEPPLPTLTPDATVDDGRGLNDLMRAHALNDSRPSAG